VNAVAQAIYTKLTTDGTLAGLLANGAGSVFHQLPRGAARPFVVFNKQGGSRAYTNTGRAFDVFVYVVKAVTEGESMKAALTIDERLDVLLGDAELTIAGHDSMSCRREAPIEYVEVVEGVRFNHAGGTYRLFVA
jgi:hypothetical protein